MTDCVEERRTQHYRGAWFGFGPVQDDERIIFAVFDTTKVNDCRLTAKSFDNKQLSANNESIVRSSFVARAVFDQMVVERGKPEKGNLVGIAWADVSNVRQLKAEFNLGRPTTINVRAFCVLDRVERGDFDGHAAMGYAETPNGVSEGQLGKVRPFIRMDLANTFSQIVDPASHQWPSRLEVFRRRVASIIRAFRAKFLPTPSGRS
jgi:hypothetical protein